MIYIAPPPGAGGEGGGGVGSRGGVERAVYVTTHLRTSTPTTDSLVLVTSRLASPRATSTPLRIVPVPCAPPLSSLPSSPLPVHYSPTLGAAILLHGFTARKRREFLRNIRETRAKRAKHPAKRPRNIRETSAKHCETPAKRLRNACETQQCGAIRRAPQCFGA